MDAVTYPEPKVIAFIEQFMVPLRVRFDEQPLTSDFNIKWTPTIITLDREGKEHHRTIGFLDPMELRASLLLGMAKVSFDGDNFSDALRSVNRLLEEFPKSGAAPEALYLRGVGQYKSTHDAQPLKDAYELLAKQYPDSEWTKRAYPYRLL